MTRPEILAVCAACLPLMAMSDVDPQRTAAVDQMANACIADPTHPQHNSDLCRAFLYGTYYQARFQQASPAPDITLQNGDQGSPGVLIQQLLRRSPSTQSLDVEQDIEYQDLRKLEQQLRDLEKQMKSVTQDMLIFTVPSENVDNQSEQIVR
ncbi:hypothetical protein WNZ14_23495 [Hoeflea sp. AS60]|uniref:hypothetical protein n=1 Tax=Hoeflea sp. AS60 TaxID=3135780 RepID=UPI0031710C7F